MMPRTRRSWGYDFLTSSQVMVQAQQSLLDLGATPLVTLNHLDEDTGFVSPGIIDVTEILSNFT